MYEFKFHRPTTVRQAAGLLARQEEAKLLAGGHTLIPTMKLRLAGPKHIIDMSKIEGLTGIEAGARSLTVGAMTPHAEVATSAVVQEAVPALARRARIVLACAEGQDNKGVAHRLRATFASTRVLNGPCHRTFAKEGWVIGRKSSSSAGRADMHEISPYFVSTQK